MSEWDLDSLDGDFQEDITDEFCYLVNPNGVIGIMSGETEGIFGYIGWEELTASKLASISTAISIFYGDSEVGNNLYKDVFSYVEKNLSGVSDEDYNIVDAGVSGVSNCAEGSMAKTIMYGQLKEKGFFDELKPVYATLEILLSIAVPDDNSLKFDSKEGLDVYLSDQIDLFEEKKSGHEKLKTNCGDKFNRVIYQLNKLYAIQDNLDESYQCALDLLGDLDLFGIQKTIDQKKLRYKQV